MAENKEVGVRKKKISIWVENTLVLVIALSRTFRYSEFSSHYRSFASFTLPIPTFWNIIFFLWLSNTYKITQNSKGTKEYGSQDSDYPRWGVWGLNEQEHEWKFLGAFWQLSHSCVGARYKGVFSLYRHDLCTSLFFFFFFFSSPLETWAWYKSFPCYSGILPPKFLCLETTIISSFFWNLFEIVYEDKYKWQSSKYYHVPTSWFFSLSSSPY